MPFVWKPQPNLPVPVPPVAIPPEEVSSKVHVVANTVNAGGVLLYNTPNVGYDVVYELDSLNVRALKATTLNASHLIINTAAITTATMNTVEIATVNFGNVFIQYGFMGSNPSSNLEIATKEYADTAAANVPAGGSDLQNIIDAKGDLLVGIAANTAARLPIGSNGQILTADSTTTTGLRWTTVTGITSVNNLLIQTHYKYFLANNQVVLRQADEIIMNDGGRTSGWSNLIADITVSGAGGLDIGVEQSSRWYEVYAIRNGSNGQMALILHSSSDTILDQSFTTTSDLGVTLLKATGGVATKIAQSFIPSVTGPLTSVELEISATGSPSGLIWVTLEADSGVDGDPSGIPLATSRVMDVSRLPTIDKARMRFVFDTNTSVSIGTTYHIVYQGDYVASDANYTTWWGLTTGGYASGSSKELREAWGNTLPLSGIQDLWFKTFVQGTPATVLNLPAGYDQSALISYVYNNSSGNFKPYVQKNRKVGMGISSDWKAFTSVTGNVEAVDLTTFVPPVVCSAKFYLWTAHASANTHSPIGGVACTDLPVTQIATPGAMTANVKGLGSQSLAPGSSTGAYGYITLENQVMLARMQNSNSRLYIGSLDF